MMGSGHGARHDPGDAGSGPANWKVAAADTIVLGFDDRHRRAHGMDRHAAGSNSC